MNLTVRRRGGGGAALSKEPCESSVPPAVGGPGVGEREGSSWSRRWWRLCGERGLLVEGGSMGILGAARIGRSMHSTRQFDTFVA